MTKIGRYKFWLVDEKSDDPRTVEEILREAFGERLIEVDHEETYEAPFDY